MQHRVSRAGIDTICAKQVEDMAGSDVTPINDARVCSQHQIVQEIEGNVERLATGLGRKVPAIVNCYFFKIDEAVIDEYSAMVVRIEKRFYSDVSRYTTSAFLCAKRGEKLASLRAEFSRTCTKP